MIAIFQATNNKSDSSTRVAVMGIPEKRIRGVEEWDLKIDAMYDVARMWQKKNRRAYPKKYTEFDDRMAWTDAEWEKMCNLSRICGTCMADYDTAVEYTDLVK